MYDKILDIRHTHTHRQWAVKLTHYIAICYKFTNSYKPSILTVAHKKKGTRPPAMSFEIASESTSGESA